MLQSSVSDAIDSRCIGSTAVERGPCLDCIAQQERELSQDKKPPAAAQLEMFTEVRKGGTYDR